MGKNTINLSDVLNSLSTPMEKTAAEVKNVDELENPEAEVGKEEKLDEKKVDHVDGKDSELLKEEDKKQEYPKEGEEENKGEKSEKTASVTPVTGLEKIAADLADVEHRTMVKEAQVFGSVMADSFATRLASVQTILDEAAPIEKTASMEKVGEFTKMASDDEYMTKVATELYHNMDEQDAAMVGSLIKEAAAEGMDVDASDAFSALADEAIAAGEAYAMNKIASAEVMTIATDEEKAMLQGFVKTAAANGHEMTEFDAYNYLAGQAQANADIEKTAEVTPEPELEKTAEEVALISELNTMEKVAAEMTANGDTEGAAKLEKYAYDKGFEDTLVKVATNTSNIGYAQTEMLFNS